MQGKWHDVRGAKQLRYHFEAEVPKWVTTAQLQRQLAEKLGVREGTVYFWRVGFRRPTPEMREALEGVLGIPQDAWLTQDELARMRRIRRLRVA